MNFRLGERTRIDPNAGKLRRAVMGISPDVMIMTVAEFEAAENRAFQRGVERGRFEQRCDDSKPNNPPREPSKDKVPASPDAGGGSILSTHPVT